jgi:hypothetical protein
MRHIALLTLAVAGLGIFIGCRDKETPSGSSGGQSASSQPASQAASRSASSQPVAPVVVESATGRIDPAGGTVRLSDGIRVEFPPGALDKSGDVTIKRLKGSPWQQVAPAGVWLDCTAPQAEFGKDVSIRVPLPVKASPQDADKILAGTIDPADGCMVMRPVRIESTAGRSEAVLDTRHFCFIYIDWNILEKAPPPSAGPLEIPIYKQGDTPYCWATCLQMLARSYSYSEGTTYNIMGKVGMAFIGNIGLRHRPIIGQVLADRTGVWPERYYWECTIFTGSDVFLTNLDHYLKHQLGVAKRPVILNPSWLEHAYVVVGYDDKGNYYVHDPREVPGAGAVSSGGGLLEGYQKLTAKQLAINWAMPGNSYSTIVIPADLPADRAKVTINLRDRKIYFSASKDFYQFNWDYTQPDGYSFQKVPLSYATKGGPKVDKIPPDAEKLTGIVELFNCTAAERMVTVRVDVVNRTTSNGRKYNYIMPEATVAVGANLRQTVNCDIDLAALRDPDVKDPQECWFVARVQDGGKFCDQAEFLFTLDKMQTISTPFATQIKTNIPGHGVDVTMAVSGVISGPQDPKAIQVKASDKGLAVYAAKFYEPTSVSVQVDYDVKMKYQIHSMFEIDKVNTLCRVDITLLNPRLEVFPRRKDMNKFDAPAGKGVSTGFFMPFKDGVFGGGVKVVLAFDQKLEVSRPIVKSDGTVIRYEPYKTYTQELDLDAVSIIASSPKK